MPNWVYAGFNVIGDAVEMERFRRAMIRPRSDVGVEPFFDIPSPPRRVELDPASKEGRRLTIDFNGIIPMPPEELCPDHEAWSVEHWGVKWNAVDVSVAFRSPEWTWFQFTTPWAFPTPVFDALADEFPSLVFAGSAYEEGGGFEFVGEFNGADDWGEGEIEWITLYDGDEADGDDDAGDVDDPGVPVDGD